MLEARGAAGADVDARGGATGPGVRGGWRGGVRAARAGKGVSIKRPPVPTPSPLRRGAALVRPWRRRMVKTAQGPRPQLGPVRPPPSGRRLAARHPRHLARRRLVPGASRYVPELF